MTAIPDEHIYQRLVLRGIWAVLYTAILIAHKTGISFPLAVTETEVELREIVL